MFIFSQMLVQVLPLLPQPPNWLLTYVRNSIRGSSILVVADIVMLLPTEVRTDHSFFP